MPCKLKLIKYRTNMHVARFVRDNVRDNNENKNKRQERRGSSYLLKSF
ncbi:MAG: hypothetical protein JXA60_09675 [Candidatus Coatesbacteria bacterium]|nr:hypothetical protein [Candidatus Coatesbacteria bacterium]